jgi:hypothetical protein
MPKAPNKTVKRPKRRMVFTQEGDTLVTRTYLGGKLVKVERRFVVKKENLH